MSNQDDAATAPSAVQAESLVVMWVGGALSLQRDGGNVRCTLWHGGPEGRFGHAGIIPVASVPAVIDVLQGLLAGDAGV